MGKVERLSHQQIQQAIKRNELRDFLEAALDWVKSHVESVVIGVVLIAALAFGATYFLKGRREAATKASMQLSMADNLFQRALASGANGQVWLQASAAYQAVKSDFAGSPEAVQAELSLAHISFESGKFEEAASGYQAFAAAHATHALAPLALAGQAACLEAQGKPGNAADAYLNVWKKYPSAANAANSVLDAARIYASLDNQAGLKECATALEKLGSQGRLPESLKAKAAAYQVKA